MAVATCEECGKNAYRTQRWAFSAALRSSRRSGLSLRAYRCPEGNGWHLTSMTKQMRKGA